ncbi:MAG: hypothetical protein WAV98_00425 [Minisyncoccia bacterium]
MYSWIWISVIFGVLAVYAWIVNPKMLVEQMDGGVTYEDCEDGAPTFLERVRITFMIVLAWAIVMAIFNHEFVWDFFQVNINFSIKL